MKILKQLQLFLKTLSHVFTTVMVLIRETQKICNVLLHQEAYTLVVEMKFGKLKLQDTKCKYISHYTLSALKEEINEYQENK